MDFTDNELRKWIESADGEQELFKQADSVRREHYGRDVYIRGLKLYELYDHKICTNEEAAEYVRCLSIRVASAGYNIVTHIGHAKKINLPSTLSS